MSRTETAKAAKPKRVSKTLRQVRVKSWELVKDNSGTSDRRTNEIRNLIVEMILIGQRN